MHNLRSRTATKTTSHLTPRNQACCRILGTNPDLTLAGRAPEVRGAVLSAGRVAGGVAVPGSLRSRHVDADLGDERLGAAPLNPRAQQLNGGLERAICSAIASVRPAICSSRKSIWVRIAPIQTACTHRSGLRAPRAGQAACSSLLAKIREHAGVRDTEQERVEHRAARRAEDVARHAVELDAGVVERPYAAGWPPASAR